MSTLKIPRFDADLIDEQQISHIFGFVAPQIVQQNNWAADYPYAPQVTFRMFHSGSHLFLRFDVVERYTMAAIIKDQGEVWTDSCVEFFLSLDNSGYYNFETTCIGTMLLAFRKERSTPEFAPEAVIKAVHRITTLPKTPFVEREGENRWSLTLIIPPTALFRHQIASWSGLKAQINLYKCGDHLSHPHFLSWQPIRTPKPDFHRPESFAEIEFA